jgi:hypothetical protein
MSDLKQGQTGASKTARNPIKDHSHHAAEKPDWIR